MREREVRRKDAEAAAAKQAAADRELRDKLVAETHGNFLDGSGLNDLAPIGSAMEIVPLERLGASSTLGRPKLPIWGEKAPRLRDHVEQFTHGSNFAAEAGFHA